MTASDLPVLDYETALEACARGDKAALRLLYERESRWLLGVAMRIVRNHELAHDVLQDAFLQIWERAGTYQRRLGSARGWIYTVVRHRALDALRRLDREIPVGDDIQSLSDLESWHDPHALAGDAEALRICLDLLDPPKRQCVVSAFVEGYTYDQIAQTLGTPLGTVKTWIRRSLIALKECLS